MRDSSEAEQPRTAMRQTAVVIGVGNVYPLRECRDRKE